MNDNDIMKRMIWITWENFIRNKSMAFMLEAKLYVFLYTGNIFIRYLYCIFKTFITLFIESPKIVFVQNPSIVLNCYMILIRPLFRYKLVSDAHFSGVIAYNGSKILQKILDLCNSSVDLVIVTNYDHVRYIQNIGGKAIVCEDPLPEINEYWTKEDEKTVLYICSFDVDEPYEKAFMAAKHLTEENFTFYVSGNYNKAKIDPAKYPFAKFLGYLPTSEYYAKLFQANVVLDLTENENCLLCGAYEAMAAEKPLVTSETISLRNYFTKGTLFTNHDAMNIANTIKLAYQDRKLLKNEIRHWKENIYSHQKDRILNIYRELGFKPRH